MRRMVLWDTACNFNGFISNQSIFNCLIIGASTLRTLLSSLLCYKYINVGSYHGITMATALQYHSYSDIMER